MWPSQGSCRENFELSCCHGITLSRDFLGAHAHVASVSFPQRTHDTVNTHLSVVPLP